jgi:hypothetical protein
MTRKELELEVKLLKQKMKTLELELELIKIKPDKEYVPYYPTYPYPIWIDDSRVQKNPWVNPYQPYCETVTTGTGTDPDKFKNYITT